jgi:hypothetical protein
MSWTWTDALALNLPGEALDKYDHSKDKNKRSDAEDFPKGRSKNRRARPGAKQLPFARTMVKQNK